MAWTLSPHVTFCVAAGEVIFLDTRRDRYFSLPGAKAECFQAWLANGTPGPLPTKLAFLSKEGLLRDGAQRHGVAPIQRQRPVAEVPVTQDWRAGFAQSWDVVGSFRSVRRALRGGLQPALDRITPPARATESAAELAASFQWVRNKFPRRPKCLLDSLALLDFLHWQNAEATIVFGINARPFAAHCWVEHRGTVLNDSLDIVSPFTPILVR